MGPARLSQPHLLPRGRQRRALRGVGAAAALQCRAAGCLQAATPSALRQTARSRRAARSVCRIRSDRKREDIMSATSISPTRREALAATAAAGAIGVFPATVGTAAADDSIRPFTVSFPEEELTELRRRLQA